MTLHNKYLFKLIAFSSSILFLNGCVSKNSNGTYNSTYSYHSYNQNTNHTRPIIHPTYTASRIYSPQPIKNRLSNSLNKNIEHTAKSMLGIEYKYGANGPYRYDCSSFTKHVFSRQGIKIPRVSRDQAKIGRFIDRNKLQKGDLIFFDSTKSSRVSHVGIYLENNQFIHASSSKKQVTLSNLNSKYYREHFKWGRRITNYSYASR